MRAGGPGSILEAFKPGTAPPDSYSAGGGESADSSPHVLNVSPELSKQIDSGLY